MVLWSCVLLCLGRAVVGLGELMATIAANRKLLACIGHRSVAMHATAMAA